MLLLSWNVNGLRAILPRDFCARLTALQPEIIALQETKVSSDIVPTLDLLRDTHPHQFWNCAEKKGYSGTALFCRRKPLAVTTGLGHPEHDREGRLLTAEFKDFFFVNVYTPNAQNELARLPYRAGSWDPAFLQFLLRLDALKPVIVCGDLNVSHQEIDLARPRQNRFNAGFSDEERSGFSRLLAAGFKDTFREFHPGEPGNYTWWSFRGQARANNIGWRLDYFLVSDRLFSRVREPHIFAQFDGSDHVPVGLTLGPAPRRSTGK